MTRGLAAFLGIVLGGIVLGSATIEAIAAKAIPLPVPAPLPKTGVAPPPPALGPALPPAAQSDIPRPPAAIPVPPASIPFPSTAAPLAPTTPPPVVAAPQTIPPAATAVPLPPAAPPRPPVAAAAPPPPIAPPATAVAPPPIILTPSAGLQIPSRPGQPSRIDADQRALVDRVSAYLSGVRTLVGDFVQVGPNGNRTIGQLYLQKPGRVRFEYEPPSPIELIADGSSMVVRDRKLATQDLYPLGQTPLRFLLADRVDLMKDTSVVGVSADDVFVTVAIEEKQMLGGTHRLTLMFDAKDLTLRQWTVTDPQGFDTTVAVYNLDPTKKPDPALFKINYERVLQ